MPTDHDFTADPDHDADPEPAAEAVRAAIERDDHTCQVCTAAGEADEFDVYVARAPPDDPPPQDVLVTICLSCGEALAGTDEANGPETDNERFQALRAFTIAQSESIRAIVALAQAAVEYVRGPGSTRDRFDDDLEVAAIDVEAENVDADADGAPQRRTAATYRANRRRVEASLAVLAARLEALEHAESAEEAVAEPFAAFRTDAAALEADLHDVTRAVDDLLASLARCPTCLEPVVASDGDADATGDRCRRCGSPVTGSWAESDRDASRNVEARLEAIDDALTDASATTERVATRASAAASVLVGDSE